MNTIKTFAEMLASSCDWSNSGINESTCNIDSKRFTTNGTIVITLRSQMNTKEMQAEMERIGVRHATIEELLAYSASEREKTLRGRLYALGTPFSQYGYPDVFYIQDKQKERQLNAHSDSDYWPQGTNFLTVTK